MSIAPITSYSQSSAFTKLSALTDSSNTLDMRIHSFIERTIKNPAFWAIASGAVIVGVVICTTLILPSFTAALISSVAIATFSIGMYNEHAQIKKHMICELGLLSRSAVEFLAPKNPRFGWYSKVTDKITLGANPLQNKNHETALVKEGHQAVLCMLESHETLPHLIGIPTTFEEWKKRNVCFVNIPTPDRTPIKDDVLDQAVEVMHQQISLDKRIYVHCNAGVGRSAVVVICYLMKYHKMSAHEATEFVNSKRLISATEENPAIVRFAENLPQVFA